MRKSWGELLNSKAKGRNWDERLPATKKHTKQSNIGTGNVKTSIYFIQKQILRTVKYEGTDLSMWCSDGETYGYSHDYLKIENENQRLNLENKNSENRYIIQEAKEIE